MKILLTMNLPYTRAHGGANRSNRKLCEELATRGHDVHVVGPALATPSPISHKQFVKNLVAEGLEPNMNDVEVTTFRSRGVQAHAVTNQSRLRSYLADQIQKIEPDWVLVSSEDPSQSLLAAALKLCPDRVIYLAHTPQMFPFGPASLYPSKERTKLVLRAAAIVTISQFVATYIKEWTNFDVFINHPPHFDTGPFPDMARFGNGYVTLLNACGVKGISIFLALARAMPDLGFAAVPGYGTTHEDMLHLTSTANIKLLENYSNLDMILSQTHVLLMPSLWVEGFGMAVIDAMLRGIPVLASNFGGLVEAKLGTDYLLPVNPIERFEDQILDNLLPSPIVPFQDTAPWQQALNSLVVDQANYEHQSKASWKASSSFVQSLSVAPFENLLTRLDKKALPDNGRQYARNTPDANRNASYAQNKSRIGTINNLTLEQRALLMVQLKRKNWDT